MSQRLRHGFGLTLAALSVLPASGHAQSHPREAASADVLFVPARPARRTAGFQAGPAPLPTVHFVPGRIGSTPPAPARARPEPTAASTPSPTPAPAVRTVATVPAPANTPAPALQAHVAAPVSVTRPTSPVPVTPPRTPELAGRCALARNLESLDLPASGSLRAVSVSLTARGNDAAALVSMARVGGAREGLLAGPSRLFFAPANGPVRAVPGPAVESDATLALGADGRVLVVHPAHRDVRAGASAPGPAIQVSVVGSRGEPVVPLRVLTDSAGLEIDSPVVAWSDGFAVVLGAEEVNEEGAEPIVHEWLYTLDEVGRQRRTRVEVTATPPDDTLGRWRTGLGAVAGRNELALAWSVPSGPTEGIWTRRYEADRGLGLAARVERRAAWGPEVAPDGSGLLFHTGGSGQRAVVYAYLPWRAREPFPLATGWLPETVFVRGRVLVGNATLRDSAGDDIDVPLAEAAPGGPLRAISTGLDADGVRALSEAIDMAMAPTDDGAVVAWLTGSPGDPGVPRRLRLARVACH